VAVAVDAAFPAMSVAVADGDQTIAADVVLVDELALGVPSVKVMLAPLRIIVVGVTAP
jgi:hypothetical protein